MSILVSLTLLSQVKATAAFSEWLMSLWTPNTPTTWQRVSLIIQATIAGPWAKWNDLVLTSQWSIWTGNIFITILALATIFLLIYKTLQFFKGRHRTSMESLSSQANSNFVKFHNEVRFGEHARSARHSEEREAISLERFTEQMSIASWLTRMEMHLNPIDQEDWARETIKLLSDKAIQSILPVERFLTQPNGYLALRRTLIANCPNNLANKQPVSLKDICTRKQMQHETACQLAQALRELAGDAFSSDNKLKDIFHRGLASKELQKLTARKLWDPNSPLSFSAFVSFTDSE